MKTIVIVVSDLMTVKAFMLPHIRTLSGKYRIHIIANSDQSKLSECDCQIYHASIERSIAPCADIKAIVGLVKLLNKLEADMVISITPKAGLLAMMSAFLCRTPHRIHFFTGQVWKTMSGIKRGFFKLLDKLLFVCTTYALIDSPSQKKYLDEQGIVDLKSSVVLGKGSVCGVNTVRFSKNPETGIRIRRQYAIADDEIVFLFLGRLKKDKGILDLATAFKRLIQNHDKARLMVVGPDEENLFSQIKEILGDDVSAFNYAEYTNTPEDYLSAADVFCLPSYREGFGSVIIEAAAAGLPSIGTKIYGIEDAVEADKSGLMYTPGDIDELVICMQRLYESEDLRTDMGYYAQRRVTEDFAEEKLTAALLAFVDERFELCDNSQMECS